MPKLGPSAQARVEYDAPPPREPQRVYAQETTVQRLAEPVTEKTLVRNLESVLGNLTRWGWPQSFPQRPEDLDLDDTELATYRKQRERAALAGKDAKLGAETLRQLQLYASWEHAVRRAESEAQSRLRVLLGVLYTATRLERHEDADTLRRHITDCFRAQVPDPMWHPASREARLFAEHYSQDLQLLPIWLRLGVVPPDGKGVRKAVTPQRGFRYAGSGEED